jgi:ABC-2 type transport system ATP-binding protein
MKSLDRKESYLLRCSRTEILLHQEVKSMSSAIEASGLRKTYPRDVVALDGLSFSVEEGTVFGLLGPNGAGKSTTVKILTTLALADDGDARVAGFDVRAEPGRVRDVIGVVSQRSGLDVQATARENLRLQGQVHGMGGKELEARAVALLDRFGLGDAADRLARTFSGGMQRRLDIALALVHRPRVLFLDEPTTGLDPAVRADMWDEIARLTSEGLTVLLTTHYLEEADRLASRLAIVDRGRVVAEGTPDELKRELRGDAVHVELEGRTNGHVADALKGVEAVREVVVNGSSLHARADDGARAVPAVLAALEACRIPVASVTVARPSLDDVYLRHAGRTFSAAEAEEEKASDAKEEIR